jgi:Predicted Zn-dependent protease (DUF2268)
MASGVALDPPPSRPLSSRSPSRSARTPDESLNRPASTLSVWSPMLQPRCSRRCPTGTESASRCDWTRASPSPRSALAESARARARQHPREALVTEGLADHFAAEVFPRTPLPPWDHALSGAREQALWERAGPDLWGSYTLGDHQRWFFGGSGIPRRPATPWGTGLSRPTSARPAPKPARSRPKRRRSSSHTFGSPKPGVGNEASFLANLWQERAATPCLAELAGSPAWAQAASLSATPVSGHRLRLDLAGSADPARPVDRPAARS